ncbi:lipopolysaccharide biosynthesis protein [uncultured Cloacibacillus sp.]|uniref:lipopolysaccharide biosynthesis protein n=1 Tax=uncultured Cloacibacillus sp. TaxID=889794 RepID=UPI0026DB3179|nr:hypothetical protein [uncultured Cloacibacillus sp.]
MGRTKALIYNSITTAALQVVTMLAGFIVPRYMLVYYGSEVNGLISSILQFIAYFNLVEAGISGAAVYALYKPLSEKDIAGVSTVVSAAKKFYMQSGYIFVLLTVLLAVLYPIYIKSPILTATEIAVLVILLGMNGCFEFFTLAKYRALLTADQKIYVISLASIVYMVLNTLTVVVLARAGTDIILLRAAVVLTIFVRSLILAIYCKIKYPSLNYSMPFPHGILDKRWDALMLQILGVIHVGAPVVIITLVLEDLKAVSVYSVYNMVLSGVSGILGIFMSGLGSSFGDVIARRQLDTLQKAYQEFECFYYSAIAAAYGVTFVMIMPFIKLYTQGVTDVNYDVPLIGFLFTLNALMYSVKTPQGMLVISAGMYHETRWQTFTQGAIMVAGGLVLAPHMSIAGVLCASIISNLYRDIDLLFFIPKHLTKLPAAKTFRRICAAFVNICLIVLIYDIFFDDDIATYWQWAFRALETTLIAAAIVSATAFISDRETLLRLLKRLRIVRS